jgi:diacylglycerol O-acyltransferase
VGLSDLNPFSGSLPLMDAGWLVAEAPEHPTHVGGLMLFELPPESDGNASQWIDATIASALRNPTLRNPFDLKLKRPHGRLGQYAWERDEDTDLLWHVRHLAIPRPGRIRELLSLVSGLHTPPLDRHRPMWEAYLIEGLEDGRVALYWRASHALMDGVAAMRQLLAAFNPDPDVRDMVPPWALDPNAPAPKSKLRGSPRTSSSSVTGTALTAVASNLKLASIVGKQIARGVSQRSDVSYPAPATIFNQRLSASRRFVAQSYDIERFKAVAKATDSTINDVVLSVCGATLRRYLLDRGELPEASLTALVPVSVRPADGPDDGNALSATLTTLATDVADPVERLARVKASMDRNKERMATMTRSELGTYGTLMFGPVLGAQVTGTAGRVPPMFNVIISNVPGPTTPLYWNGARLDGMYPMSLLFDGYALNITQTSYAGSFEFGITADRKAVPHMQRMIDHLEDSLEAIEVKLGLR